MMIIIIACLSSVSGLGLGPGVYGVKRAFFFTLLSLRSPCEEELRVEFMYNGFPFPSRTYLLVEV